MAWWKVLYGKGPYRSPEYRRGPMVPSARPALLTLRSLDRNQILGRRVCMLYDDKCHMMMMMMTTICSLCLYDDKKWKSIIFHWHNADLSRRGTAGASAVQVEMDVVSDSTMRWTGRSDWQSTISSCALRRSSGSKRCTLRRTGSTSPGNLQYTCTSLLGEKAVYAAKDWQYNSW
jgi:hypothetical protein